MGLDGVELILATEEEFGISIDDVDAERLNTPRDLADYVAYRLGAAKAGAKRCLSQAGFHRLRAVLVRQFGARRSDVRPDSRITDFLRGKMRTQWSELRLAIGGTLPGLECGQPTRGVLTVGVPLVTGALLLWLQPSLWIGMPVVIASWIGGTVAAERMGSKVPDTLTAVGGIVPYVRVHDTDEWRYDEILRRVILMTSEQLGVPLERIEPDHHFVKDLGLQ